MRKKGNQWDWNGLDMQNCDTGNNDQKFTFTPENISSYLLSSLPLNVTHASTLVLEKTKRIWDES